jgi:hypothetical protein
VFRLVELSKKFYNLIPHTQTPTIDSDSMMKEKLSMLEVTSYNINGTDDIMKVLTDIEIANRIMRDTGKVGRYSIKHIN